MVVWHSREWVDLIRYKHIGQARYVERLRINNVDIESDTIQWRTVLLIVYAYLCLVFYFY